MTRLGIVQVSIENKIYNVAVVDPAEYRRFTESRSALLQDQWDRVAGGELAVAQGLKNRLPIDDDGYLRLGSGEDDAASCTSAPTPRRSRPSTWSSTPRGARSSGWTGPNALLVSAGESTPQALSKPIGRLVGDAGPAELDIASRLGLDPGVFQSAVLVGDLRRRGRHFRYTVLSGGRIAPDPAWVSEPHHHRGGADPRRGHLQQGIFPQLKAALAEIVHARAGRRDPPRRVRRLLLPALHRRLHPAVQPRFGLALDLNVPGNQRGTVGEMDREVVAIFKKWGFGWGGDWSYTDPMHFEMNRIVNPG